MAENLVADSNPFANHSPLELLISSILMTLGVGLPYISPKFDELKATTIDLDYCLPGRR